MKEIRSRQIIHTWMHSHTHASVFLNVQEEQKSLSSCSKWHGFNTMYAYLKLEASMHPMDAPLKCALKLCCASGRQNTRQSPKKVMLCVDKERNDMRSALWSCICSNKACRLAWASFVGPMLMHAYEVSILHFSSTAALVATPSTPTISISKYYVCTYIHNI